MASALSDPNVRKRVLVARTHSIPLAVGARDVTRGSRLGGRAPASVVAMHPACVNCGRPLLHVLTLASDHAGPMLGRGVSTSLLCCPEFKCRLEHNPDPDKASLVVLRHEDGPPSAEPSAHDGTWPGRRLGAGRPRKDGILVFGIERPLKTSKLGGRPGYLQDLEYYRRPMEERGLSYLFQFGEDSLPIKGFKPLFAFGTVYVFGKIDVKGRALDGDLRAFFQYT